MEVTEPKALPILLCAAPEGVLVIVTLPDGTQRYERFGWGDSINGRRVISYEVGPTGVLVVHDEQGGGFVSWEDFAAAVAKSGQVVDAATRAYGMAVVANIQTPDTLVKG